MMQPLFDLIAAPPGGFLYHLALAFCAAAALITFRLSQKPLSLPAQKRKARALWVILAGQLLLAFVCILAWLEVLPARQILPPLNQFILTLSVAWAAWAWIQQGLHLTLDTILAAVHILAAALLAATVMGWNPEPIGVNFISTWFHGIWELFSLLIVLIAGGFILRRRLPGWISGLSFLAIQALAIMADFLIHQPGQDFSAPLILAQLAAFPFLLTLPGKADTATSGSETPKPDLAPGFVNPRPVTRERRRYATDQKTFQSALNLAVETRPGLLHSTITRFVAHMLVSDLCFLVRAPDPSGDVIIEGGYDLIQEENWPGASIPALSIPVIAAAITAGQPLRILDGDENSADLYQLAGVLGINETGNMLFAPLTHEVNGPLGGLILLSAYSERIWSQADEDYLMAGTEQLTRLLQKPERFPASGPAAALPMADAIPPEYVREFFASLLDGDEAPTDLARDAELQQTLELLREENRRLLSALEASRTVGAADDATPGRQQVRELEQALYYANLRIEKLEKAEPGKAASTAPTLPSLIEAALVQAGRLSGDKHVTMRVDIPSNLPPIQADAAALKEVLVIALQKALQDTAAQGTIVLKAQAGASPEGTAHIHLKVISTAVPSNDPIMDEASIQKARSLLAAQSGRIWVDPLAGGAVVTNLVVPAYPDGLRTQGNL